MLGFQNNVFPGVIKLCGAEQEMTVERLHIYYR